MTFKAREVARTAHGIAYVTDPPQDEYVTRAQRVWWYPWLVLADGSRVDLQEQATPMQAELAARTALDRAASDDGPDCDRCEGSGITEDRFTGELRTCRSCGGTGTWL